ncbi:MAG TPA: hypothetical protein VK624_18180 [Steroidobacteraceae bacterium]|jgi:hypothetical protein|nr:hypothetical protein [Steroidobacteraceae bacterium]
MSALASICLQFASWLLRKEHSEWARAMHSEFQHVGESERLSWAFGCVVAAIKQRWAPMNTGDFRISRWVMLVEILGCFGPLTLGWSLFTFDQPGLIHHSLADVERWYLPLPGGAFIISMMIAGAVVGVIGPIGLFLGLRYVVFGRALESKALGAALIGTPILLTIVGWIAGMFFGPPDFRPQFDSITFVFVCLPVAAFAHLMYLARPAAPPQILAVA